MMKLFVAIFLLTTTLQAQTIYTQSGTSRDMLPLNAGVTGLAIIDAQGVSHPLAMVAPDMYAVIDVTVGQDQYTTCMAATPTNAMNCQIAQQQQQTTDGVNRFRAWLNDLEAGFASGSLKTTTLNDLMAKYNLWHLKQ